MLMLMLIKETHVSEHTVGPVPWLLTTQNRTTENA